MSSNPSNPAPSGSGLPQSGTVLSGPQASQLIKRLQLAMEGQGAQGQTIKIQTVQTNPQTGMRQIIAIPISTGAGMTSSSGSKISVSPLKMRATTASTAMSSPPVVSGTTSTLGPNVKVVKLVGGQHQVVVQQQQQQQQAQVLTPSKQGRGQAMNFLSPLLDSSGSRKRSDIDFDAFSDAKRKKSDKGGKGLRHFSMKVCEKVQAKGVTSYNEVADELVSELTDPRCTSPTDQQYDQKNIRRRVYDALNVLMAMNIISKEKKEIRWLGLPTNSVQEANGLEIDKKKRMERIRAKTQQLQDLILQQIAFKNLVERNKEREKVEGSPAPNSAIQLPFIIVNTSKKTVIDCSISNDKMEYLFNFDDTFEIHDDMEVLKRMGLSFGLEHGRVTPDDLTRARNMVPRALEQYVIQLAENGPAQGPGAKCAMPKVSDPVVLKHATAKIEGEEGNVHESEISESDIDIS